MLRVQPGARVTAWAGRSTDGRVRLRVAAPAREGRANEVVLSFVAEALGLRRSAVRLERGPGSRDKVLGIDLEPGELERRIAKAMGNE